MRSMASRVEDAQLILFFFSASVARCDSVVVAAHWTLAAFKDQHREPFVGHKRVSRQVNLEIR